MLAVATNISSGGVALVFIANQVPGLLVKLSVPLWFHIVSYRTRMVMASVSMAIALLLVGIGGKFRDHGQNNDNQDNDGSGQSLGLALELFGISFISFQGALGEATLLALSGRFDSLILPKLDDSYRAVDDADEHFSEQDAQSSGDVEPSIQRRCITAFSSGTGLAGIAGYAYKSLFADLIGLGLSGTVWSAIVFALVYWLKFRCLYRVEEKWAVSNESTSEVAGDNRITASESSYLADDAVDIDEAFSAEGPKGNVSLPLETAHQRGQDPTGFGRFKLLLSLWMYTVPLFTVYAAEYVLQAGVWPAIGFPVTDSKARAEFYHFANWTYQGGVYISRSSGNLWVASMRALWIMPILQIVNLYFFLMVSIHHFWYDYGLLALCFFAGLLGGSVYVQGFSRINADMPPHQKESAVASAGVADSLGIFVADVVSLFVQSCIYKRNEIGGAVVECPVR